MLKEVASESYPVELGTSALMPEFENGVLGMKENEERDVEIPFPDDYPDKNIASKTLLFKITMKEIKQKRLPQINDDFAKDLSYENMEALKAATKEELLKEKEGLQNRETTEKILDALMKNLTIDVPKRLLDKRVAGMIDEALSRYQPGRLSEADMKAIEERLRAEFTTRAENRLKTEIVLHRIAGEEGITTSDEDVEERLKKIAEDANKTYNEMKGLYEQYNLIGGLKSSIIEEKTIAFLKENAVIKEKA
jgi:trigger factor